MAKQEILNLFETNENLSENLLEFYPYDIAIALTEIDATFHRKFFDLEKEFVADVLSKLETEQFLKITEQLEPIEVSKILQKMDFDDAVDILKEVDEENQLVYLKFMDTEVRNKTRELMNYDDSTAGALMTHEYIWVPITCTIKEAMKIVISKAKEAYIVDSIYVTENFKLVGVISLRELIIARAEEKLADIITTNYVAVKPLDNKNIVAEKMMNYDFTVLPVIDKNNKMKGVVTIDDIVDLIDEEAVEDISALAGVSDVDIDQDNETVLDTLKKRLPWLLILVVLGFATSIILASFEETLISIPILAMFLPLILNMSGNTGTQSLAVTVRGISRNQFNNKKNIFKHLLREFKTALLMAIILSVVVFVFAYVMGMIYGETDIAFSFIIALSVLIALTFSTLAGSIIPIIIEALKIDPAVASGPFITTINDIVSLSIYLTLASILIL